MKKMVGGRDYEMRRDNDAPLDRSAWVIMIRGNGYDKLCGRFHNIKKEGQKITFGFEPTYIPNHLEDRSLPSLTELQAPRLSADQQLMSVLSGILYDILDKNRVKDALIFTDVETGENLNRSLK